MNAKPWVITVSACGFVTAALAGIKFVQISQAMAFMDSFPPAYETVTVASAEADEWQPTRLLRSSSEKHSGLAAFFFLHLHPNSAGTAIFPDDRLRSLLT